MMDKISEFVGECGICGAEIKIKRSDDDRFLVWPCRCQTERDLAAVKQNLSVLDHIIKACTASGTRP